LPDAHLFRRFVFRLEFARQLAWRLQVLKSEMLLLMKERDSSGFLATFWLILMHAPSFAFVAMRCRCALGEILTPFQLAAAVLAAPFDGQNSNHAISFPLWLTIHFMMA
jgi:hypothetical protein